MKRRQVTLDDGRTLIFYTFEDQEEEAWPPDPPNPEIREEEPRV